MSDKNEAAPPPSAEIASSTSALTSIGALADVREGAVVREVMEELAAPRSVPLPSYDDHSLLVLPKGMQVLDTKRLLEPHLEKPVRRTGTANLTDLASFIALAKRFMNPEMAVFMDDNRQSPSVQVIFDYNEGGPDLDKARHMKHRAKYAPKLSEPWQFWQQINNKAFSQAEFQKLLEDRLGDFIAAPDIQVGTATAADVNLVSIARQYGSTIASPERLVDLAKGLKLTETSEVVNEVNLQNGTQQLVYKTQYNQRAENGEMVPLEVPGFALLCLPVFERGAAWRMLTRLRYRKNGGELKWWFTLHRSDLIFDAALQEVADTIQLEIPTIPLFRGSPEK